MNKEIKSGVILSYLLLILNTLYGLIITPYILKYVGENAYGVLPPSLYMLTKKNALQRHATP